MTPKKLAFFAILLVLITSLLLSSCIFSKPGNTEDQITSTKTTTSSLATPPTSTATTSSTYSTPITTLTPSIDDQPSTTPIPTTSGGSQPSTTPTPTSISGGSQPSTTPTPTTSTGSQPSTTPTPTTTDGSGQASTTPTPTKTVEGSSSDWSTTQTAAPSWLTRQGDPAHTGMVDQAFPIALEPKWVAQPSQPWSSQRSAVVADHEMVVVADVPHYYSKVGIWGQNDGNYSPWANVEPYEMQGELNTTENAIYAFHLADGSQKWRVTIEGAVVGYPQIVDGRVYTTTWKIRTSSESPKVSIIYCLDGQDGSLLWQYTIQDAFVKELTVDEGVVVISNLQYWDNKIIGLNSLTGELLWTQNFSKYLSPNLHPVAISEGRIFVVFPTDNISALDLYTGNLIWQNSDYIGHFTGSVPVTANRRLYLLGSYQYDGFFVFAFDANTGEFLWKAPVDHRGELTLDPLQNTLYVSDSDEITALSALDGTHLWQVEDYIDITYLSCVDMNCLCVGEYSQGCYHSLVQHTTDHPVIIGNNHRLLSPLGLMDQASGELIWRSSPRDPNDINPFLHAALAWSSKKYGSTFEEWLPNDYVVNADGNEVLLSGFGTWIGPPAVSGDLVIGWAESRTRWDTPTPSTSKDLVAFGPDTTPPDVRINQGIKDDSLLYMQITVYDYNLKEWTLEIRNDQAQTNWKVVAAGLQSLQYIQLLNIFTGAGFWEIEQEELFKPLTDGTWTLRLTAIDTTGLSSSVESIHVVDTTGPMVQIISPEDGTTFIGNGDIRLDGIASDMSDITQVRVTSDGGRTYTTATGTNGWYVILPITEKMEGKTVTFQAVATDSLGNEGRSEPVTITFPTFEVELQSGGRMLSGSRSLFINKDDDIDGDGIEQRWENEIINLTMPILELDEEEAWLDQFKTLPKLAGTKYPMAFFVRVTGYTPEFYKQNNPSHPPYILVYIAFGWHKDWGAANSPLTDFSFTDYLKAHRGDTENVVMAWRVMDETNLMLEWVRTSSHENPCQHHSVWSPWHRTCNLANIAEKKIGIDLDFVIGATQILCSELEFDPSGHLVLYPGEDKHPLYPSPQLCEEVELHVSGYGEDCGWDPYTGILDTFQWKDDDFKSDRRYRGGGRWLFDGYNAGEPDPNNRYQLIDFLDWPDTWRGLTGTQKKRLTGLYPTEAVWSGNIFKRAMWDCNKQGLCKLVPGKGGSDFCGGLLPPPMTIEPQTCSSKLGKALGQAGDWTDKGPPDLMRTVLNARYRVTFTTDSQLFAGTNANLLFYLVRDESTLSLSTKRTILTTADYSKNNDSFPYLPVGTFETGDVDTVYIDDNRPGPIVAIQVQHDDPGDGQQFNPDPDWFLKRVVVTDLLTGEIWIAEPNRWITRTANRIPLAPYQPNATRQIEYQVTVRTGDLKDAGTDGEIFIKLFGVGDAISSSLKLDDPNANDFERDTVATYAVTSKDVGTLDRILLILEPNKSSPDWYCQEVTVRNMLTGQVWTFPVEKWLGKGDGPVKVEVKLNE